MFSKNVFRAVAMVTGALLILWGLTGIENAMQITETERKISETRERLAIDLKIIKKSAAAEMQLGTWLFGKLQKEIAQQENADLQLKLANKFLRKFSARFEDYFGWELFLFKDSQNSYYSQQSLQSLFSDHKRKEFPVKPFKALLIKGLASLSDKKISSSVHSYLKKKVVMQLDDFTAKDQTGTLRKALGNFEPITFRKTGYFIAWVPLFKKGWTTSIQRYEKIDLKVFDKRKFNRLYLSGIAVIHIKKEDLKKIRDEVTIFALKENMQKQGCNLDFREVSKDFAGFDAVKTGFLTNAKDRMFALTGLQIGERLFKIKASRKIESFVDLYRFRKPIGFLLKTLWMTGVLYFTGSFLFLKRPLRMNLTVQLLLFVVWMLFPVFYAGYCLMERNVIEKQAAAMSELKIKMERLANSFDSSLELYKTWVCERISNALETTLAFYDGHNYQHEKEFLENMLRDFNARLLKEGVYSKNVFMLDSAFQVRSIFTGADDKQMKLFQRFFTSIYTSHLSGASMRKNKERLGSDILTGAQTEELLNIARTLLSAEVISNMSMKKESLERLEGFGDSAYIYHKYYNTQNDKRSILHVGIYKPALQRICMIDWLDCFFDSDLRGIEWLVVNRSKPSWFHRYPFWKTHTQGKMGLLYPILDFIPPQLAFFSHVSANADESFTAQVEYDGHKYLFTCLPGHNMGDYIIALLLPLEGYFTRIDSFRRRIWFAMGLIFLLCTIIGAWLAAGFINPIKLFAKKAIAVTKSEFDQKLESEGQDMEISLLAKSFNKVIANLREGRTLKKFVSETTLEVLPHISRTKSCPEKIRAVVLFISLDNFWKASIELGPKQAVVQLNDFFAQVCMLLHETGGDVSKFIGEKVMAVFKISDPESEAEVALQVVKFVEKLQKKHQEDNTCLKNMKLKIGIAAGEILAGIIGGDKTRLEQTVIGDKVNLAARLCSFSSSETALTDETFAAIVAAINKPGLMVKKLPDQRIKGKKNMVSVFCLRTKKEKILS